MTMNVQYVNPFLEATHDVIKETSGAEMERVYMTQKQVPYPTHDVTVILGLTGELSGQVIVSLEQQLAILLANKMIATMAGMEMNLPEFDEMCKSAINEMGNMICGRAIANIDLDGLNISPPMLIEGKGAQISNTGMVNLAVGFKLGEAELEVIIAIKE
jgi:chemotaxis protein CheX